MANDSQLRASEIKGVLLSEIENYSEELHAEEVGEVLEVKDGVARIYGLTKAMASEMLEITSASTGETVTALALNLEEDNIGAVIMGDWTELEEGEQNLLDPAVVLENADEQHHDRSSVRRPPPSVNRHRPARGRRRKSHRPPMGHRCYPPSVVLPFFRPHRRGT